MSNFEQTFKKTIGHEGGYVNDPDDPGGETKWGISKRSYPAVDIGHLTLTMAEGIYRRDFWDRLKCDEVDADVGAELFDTGVNMGVSKAAKIFQEALNLANRNERDYKNIAIDGGLGQLTLAAYRSNRNKRLLFNLMNLLQGEHYINLMRNNEVKEKYVGWFNRVEVKKN